jgi:hypothetical protein
MRIQKPIAPVNVNPLLLLKTIEEAKGIEHSNVLIIMHPFFWMLKDESA